MNKNALPQPIHSRLRLMQSIDLAAAKAMYMEAVDIFVPEHLIERANLPRGHWEKQAVENGVIPGQHDEYIEACQRAAQASLEQARVVGVERLCQYPIDPRVVRLLCLTCDDEELELPEYMR